MAILSMPTSPRFKRRRFRLATNTIVHGGSLDNAEQVVELDGARWVLDAELPDMAAGSADARAWQAFLAELDGPAGLFYAGDPWAIEPVGSAKDTPGTPVVAGAGQTGKTLNIDGCPASATGYLLAADYFAVELASGSRSLHRMTANADTDGAGAVTLNYRPALFESPADNATIIVEPATCVMRLLDDNQADDDIDESGFLKIAFTAVQTFEDVTA